MESIERNAFFGDWVSDVRTIAFNINTQDVHASRCAVRLDGPRPRTLSRLELFQLCRTAMLAGVPARESSRGIPAV